MANLVSGMDTRWQHSGSDRASENLGVLGAAHCGRTASRRPAPTGGLQVLQMSKNAGGWPLPSFSRQGRRAQPQGDLRGLSISGNIGTYVI